MLWLTKTIRVYRHLVFTCISLLICANCSIHIQTYMFCIEAGLPIGPSRQLPKGLRPPQPPNWLRIGYFLVILIPKIEFWKPFSDYYIHWFSDVNYNMQFWWSFPFKGIVLDIIFGYINVYSTFNTASAAVNVSLHLSLSKKLIILVSTVGPCFLIKFLWIKLPQTYFTQWKPAARSPVWWFLHIWSCHV